MLDHRLLVSNPDFVVAMLNKRNRGDLVPHVGKIVDLDKNRRELLQEVESLKHQRNEASQQIAQFKKEKRDATPLMEKMKGVAETIKTLDEKVAAIDETLRATLYELPNLLKETVPEGKSAENNREIHKWGTPREFTHRVLSHDEIGENLGILNFKKAGEVTGARFVYLRGQAAAIERALIQFMIKTHVQAGYEEMVPPFMVNRAALLGTGQLPKFEDDVFHIEKFGFYLIPTAEVPVTNYFREEILSENDLPKKFVAYTPCFRSEAGSYGKDTKGLKRQHQFNKVELVKFVKPSESDAELEALLSDAEKILQLLELPYRVVALCGGDIGFHSAKTYDIEVWSPFLKGWMEISSCSTFVDYQARRANIRYRDSQTGKVAFVHTLNGSGLAVGRTLLAIMENYQKADGTFDVPKALKPYL